MPDLSLVDVHKSYPTRGEPLRVLRGCSLTLSRGENVAIVGPSGSGKSTLLHVLGGLEPPTSGEVRLGGDNPFALAEDALARFRARHVGFIFQEHYLLPQLSAWENALTPTLALGAAPADAAERARDLLTRVGLAERLEHRPAELSGGERQRVAVARALMNRPTLLLADEPTGSLDRSSAAEVGELLLELQAREQTMLIVVTHSRELAGRMRRQLELDGGRLRELGAAAGGRDDRDQERAP